MPMKLVTLLHIKAVDMMKLAKKWSLKEILQTSIKTRMLEWGFLGPIVTSILIIFAGLIAVFAAYGHFILGK